MMATRTAILVLLLSSVTSLKLSLKQVSHDHNETKLLEDRAFSEREEEDNEYEEEDGESDAEMEGFSPKTCLKSQKYPFLTKYMMGGACVGCIDKAFECIAELAAPGSSASAYLAAAGVCVVKLKKCVKKIKKVGFGVKIWKAVKDGIPIEEIDLPSGLGAEPCYEVIQLLMAGQALGSSETSEVSDNGSSAECEVNTVVGVHAGGYGNEVSWAITDAQGETICSNTMPYQTGQDYDETCSGCLGAETYTVDCHDSFGDGWNGAYLVVGNQLLCDEFTYGSTYSQTLSLDPAEAVASSLLSQLLSAIGYSSLSEFEDELSEYVDYYPSWLDNGS